MQWLLIKHSKTAMLSNTAYTYTINNLLLTTKKVIKRCTDPMTFLKNGPKNSFTGLVVNSYTNSVKKHTWGDDSVALIHF